MGRFAARILLLLGVLFCFSDEARAGSRSVCGTNEQTAARLRALHAWQEKRAVGCRESKDVTSDESSVVDGVFVMEADEETLFLDHPFDLANSSVVLQRLDANRFRVSRTTLQYESNTGPLLTTFSPFRGRYFRTYELQNFTFPFADGNFQRLYLTAFNSIHVVPPELMFTPQVDNLEAIVQQQPLISPLLHTAYTPIGLNTIELYVVESTDNVVITWKGLGDLGYDIQARLHKNGDIIFSYRLMERISWGTAVVGQGRAALQQNSKLLKSSTDQTKDVDLSYAPELRDRLDIVSTSVSRLVEADLLEIRIESGAPITTAGLSPEDSLLYFVFFDDGSFDPPFVGIEFAADGTIYGLRQTGVVVNSHATYAEGSAVVLLTLQGDLALAAGPIDVLVVTATLLEEDLADFAITSLAFDPPMRYLAADISSLGPGELSVPLVEAFTVPTLDPFAVYDQLVSRYRLSHERVDALAIYQTFFTDIIFFASAFAVYGNPGDDGVAADRFGYGSTRRRFPTLMHMNVVDYDWNESPDSAGSIVLHEFGHRWLYGLRINEGGQNTRSLNPTTDHPAQFVHTPAAFPVRTSTDFSTMGGSYFLDNGNGTFTASNFAAYGYSWTDLYLMGLAAPEEIPPWFYIANSQPPLGDQYSPPDGITVSGERRNVTIQQAIDAQGPRSPSYSTSQRLFRVYFVLLTRPGESPSSLQLAKIFEHRNLLEELFSKATGSRGTVIVRFEEPSRRRGVRR